MCYLREMMLFFPASATMNGSWQEARWAALSSKNQNCRSRAKPINCQRCRSPVRVCLHSLFVRVRANMVAMYPKMKNSSANDATPTPRGT